MSPWFSRGWTSLELANSSKVKVLFKGSNGPLVKDLDEDILAKPGEKSERHCIASSVIRNLRTKGIGKINQLLSVLSPRHTSWPRDVAIISGHLVGIRIDPAATQQNLYQDILKKIRFISHEHLFHNTISMSKGFNWCPTNIFDLPQSSASATPSLIIEKNGDVTGEWRVLDNIPKEGYNWKHTHPLMKVMLCSSLERPAGHLLLVAPKDESVTRALLVKVINGEIVQFVGPVYFHSPLRLEKGDEEMRKIVIMGEAEVTMGKRPGSEDSQNSDLLLAATNGDEKKVAQLLEILDPNIQDKNKRTALHLAAQNGHKEVVQLLLRKVDFNLQDEEGKTALHLAAQKGHEEVVQPLLEKGAEPNLQDSEKKTALHLAAKNGHQEVVQLLLRKSEPNLQEKEGKTALHLAAQDGHEEVVQLLVKGAEPNCQDKEAKTALHLAAQNGHAKVVQLLLENGANPDSLDKYNYIMRPGGVITW
jgi:hypothetical protein